jgi:hypothetical protein
MIYFLYFFYKHNFKKYNYLIDHEVIKDFQEEHKVNLCCSLSSCFLEKTVIKNSSAQLSQPRGRRDFRLELLL